MAQFADDREVDVEYLYPPLKGAGALTNPAVGSVTIHKSAQDERFEAIEKQIAEMQADADELMLKFCAVLTLMAEMGKKLDALLAAQGDSQ